MVIAVLIKTLKIQAIILPKIAATFMLQEIVILISTPKDPILVKILTLRFNVMIKVEFIAIKSMTISVARDFGLFISMLKNIIGIKILSILVKELFG